MKKAIVVLAILAGLVVSIAQPAISYAKSCAKAVSAFAYETTVKAYDLLTIGMGKMGMILYATYQPVSGKSPYSGDDGNRVVFTDDAVVAANLATTDAVNLVKLPAGTLVDRVVIKNPDLDSGAVLAVNIGFANVDGSTGPSATAVASAATTWQAVATTTYELFPPVKLTKDAYLQAVPTVGGTGTGTIYAKVEGEALGAA